LIFRPEISNYPPGGDALRAQADIYTLRSTKRRAPSEHGRTRNGANKARHLREATPKEINHEKTYTKGITQNEGTTKRRTGLIVMDKNISRQALYGNRNFRGDTFA